VGVDDDGDRSDPFEGLQLDESFVADATVRELPASVRLERLRRIDAGHREIHGDRSEDHRQLYRREQRLRRRRWLTILIVLVLVGSVLSWSALRDRAREAERSLGQLGPGLVVNDGKSSSASRNAGLSPAASAEEQSHPIGAPAGTAGGTGPYKFMMTQPDSAKPVAYDPCRPIHVVVNNHLAPLQSDVVLQAAIARVSTATGLQFIVDGVTDETSSDNREPFQKDRYGDRWAPVLVAWTDPNETSDLAGNTAGEAGSTSIQTEKGKVYVSGEVRLDGPQLGQAMAEPDGRAGVQAVIEHELGHLVGLDHVDDATQLMYPSTDGSVTDYADGDLLGLDQLGRGACFPDV